MAASALEQRQRIIKIHGPASVFILRISRIQLSFKIQIFYIFFKINNNTRTHTVGQKSENMMLFK